MKLKRYVTYYTHTDGSKWIGPDYWAQTLLEAQMLAMEYPVQPITIMGEHIESGVCRDGDIEVEYMAGPHRNIH